jgi:hypothetical protein
VQKVDIRVNQTLFDLASLRVRYELYFTWLPVKQAWRLSGGSGRNRWYTDWFFSSCQAAGVIAANFYLNEFGSRSNRDLRHWFADSQRK